MDRAISDSSVIEINWNTPDSSRGVSMESESPRDVIEVPQGGRDSLSQTFQGLAMSDDERNNVRNIIAQSAYRTAQSSFDWGRSPSELLQPTRRASGVVEMEQRQAELEMPNPYRDYGESPFSQPWESSPWNPDSNPPYGSDRTFGSPSRISPRFSDSFTGVTREDYLYTNTPSNQRQPSIPNGYWERNPIGRNAAVFPHLNSFLDNTSSDDEDDDARRARLARRSRD